MIKFAEIVGTILTLVSLGLISESYLLYGFLIGIVGNFFWVYFGYATRAPWLMGLNIIIGFINLNGLNNLKILW